MRAEYPALLLTTVLASTTPAFADNYEGNLTGDWGGHRTTLSEMGVDIEAVYTVDFMNNVAGGLRRRGNFLDNTDVTATFDGEKLYGVKGSTIFLYFLNNNGTSFDAKNVGSVQGTDNIEVSTHTAKLYEAWIEQNFFDDEYSLRAGLYDLNSEFYVTDSSGIFINSTFGIGTEMAQSGAGGPSIFPTTSLAARFKWQPTEQAYLMAAILDGVSGDPGDAKGTQVTLADKDGALLVAEASYTFDFARLAIGGWHYTSQTADLVNAALKHHNQGAYAMAEKELFEGGTFFLRGGFANEDVNQTDYSWATGIFLENMIESRPDGQFGFAVTGAHNSDAHKAANAGVDSAEYGFELTYSDQITPWLRIQPDLQYTINPGTVGTSATKVDNSWVMGARFEINF